MKSLSVSPAALLLQRLRLTIMKQSVLFSTSFVAVSQHPPSKSATTPESRHLSKREGEKRSAEAKPRTWEVMKKHRGLTEGILASPMQPRRGIQVGNQVRTRAYRSGCCCVGGSEGVRTRTNAQSKQSVDPAPASLRYPGLGSM